MSPRWAVTAIFLLNGVALASWAARLPALEDALDRFAHLVGHRATDLLERAVG